MEDKLIHLLIIWSNGIDHLDFILSDLKKDFQILNTFKFSWNKEYFYENLKKFYAHSQKNLSEKQYDNLLKNKISHCGNGDFFAIVFEDGNPNFEERKTSSGQNIVNTNVFDKKINYRMLSGGGHLIHASDNFFESNKDILLLFGCDLENFKIKYPKIDGIQQLNRNILGTPSWKNLKEFFFVLNNTIDYVVLRNFENFPNEYKFNDHGDIDLLVENKNYIKFLTGAVDKYADVDYRVYHEININNEKIPFDFRFIGDKYYDIKWQLNILKTRILNKNGVYVPNIENYFYSLLYHAYIQKKFVAPDYKEKLHLLSKRIDIEYCSDNKKKIFLVLDSFMKKNNYSYTLPKDLTVFFNSFFLKDFQVENESHGHLISSTVSRTSDQIFTSEVFENKDFFVKVATNPIGQNEFKFLKKLEKYPCFPKCLKIIEKENHSLVYINRVDGFSLLEINYKKSFWNVINVVVFFEECINILIILLKNRILHKDIRPSNIIINRTSNNKFRPVLIDFGWSSYINEESLTPFGLGSTERWKGTGFSDAYSMGLTLERYFGRLDFLKNYIDELKLIEPKDYYGIEELIKKLIVLRSQPRKELNLRSVNFRFKILIKKYRLAEKYIRFIKYFKNS